MEELSSAEQQRSQSPVQAPDDLASISREFPEWHSWSSSAGRSWATRQGSAPSPQGQDPEWAMTIDADDLEGLREGLRRQESLETRLPPSGAA
jgi:hypothetical protein